jgi:hypothetical protein
MEKIPPTMIICFEDDEESTIYITKEYACTNERYKIMKLNDKIIDYDEILYTLLEEEKLIAAVVTFGYISL